MAIEHSFDNSLLLEFGRDEAIAGVDEVGRGALFGAVVAAAVVVPLNGVGRLIELGVTDSKELSPKKRAALVEPIKQAVSAWQIAAASPREIDELNILQASLLAMKRCIVNLPVAPDVCLVDGKFTIPNLNLAQKTVIKGDLRSPIIAAASILAKEWRDRSIIELAERYPSYDLTNNKGYPTAKHIAAIQQHGITPEHRRSFKSCKMPDLA